MEALLSQFTFLSDQALQDKNFDPLTIESLMNLFEIESYKAWVAMELEQEEEVKEAEITVQQAKDYLDSAMEAAMEEFRRFEEEMERLSMAELDGLEETAEKARNMGNIEAAVNSAIASVKSASNKVHPS